MSSLGALPKLRLGEKLPGGGVRSHGAKTVKFLSEPEGVTIRKMGKPIKALRFEVEYEGTRYYWYIDVLNREGQPNYLLERVLDINIGDERILEMRKQGAINYVDVRLLGEVPRMPDDDEGEEVIRYDDEEVPGATT